MAVAMLRPRVRFWVSMVTLQFITYGPAPTPADDREDNDLPAVPHLTP